MISVAYQDRIAITHLEDRTSRPIGAVEILESERARLFHTVVIDLVKIHFDRRIVNFMLVRRITRPIAPRRINLHQDQLVRRKGTWEYIDNLTRRIFTTTQIARNICGRNQPGLQRSRGRHPELGDLTSCLGLQINSVAGWKIKRVRQSIKNTLSASGQYLPFS